MPQSILSLCDDSGSLPDLPIGTRVGQLTSGLRCYVKGSWQLIGNEYRLPVGSLTDNVNDEWWTTYIGDTEESLRQWYLCPIVKMD